MSISIIAFALILVALLLSVRFGLLAAGGMLLPFGMTAALTAGGTSINVADLYFIFVGSFFLVRNLSFHLPRNFVLPIAFAVFCLVTAVALPRLFSGIYVFPVNGIKDGTRVSSLFASSVVPLAPSSGNLSQSAYVILGMFYLMVFATVAHCRPEKIHSLLIIAAVSNIAISFVALVAGADVLEPFRTADYKSLENAAVGNITRMVGAFPEASRYADFTAPLGVYFIAHFTTSGEQKGLYLGLILTALAILALSSTGFVAVGVAALFVLARSFGTTARFKRIMWLLLPVVAALLIVTMVLPGLIGELLSRLIFDKGTSVSGFERGAWAARGWQNATETYFFGVGAGSARSNGLIFVLLSNVGIIGTVMFSTIIWRAVQKNSTTPILLGLSAALVAILASRLVSQTTIAPGIFFTILIGAKTPIVTRVAQAVRENRTLPRASLK